MSPLDSWGRKVPKRVSRSELRRFAATIRHWRYRGETYTWQRLHTFSFWYWLRCRGRIIEWATIDSPEPDDELEGIPWPTRDSLGRLCERCERTFPDRTAYASHFETSIGCKRRRSDQEIGR